MSSEHKITIVGESNPYGGDDCYALYPAPDGCSGHRLCVLVFGMYRSDYLDLFIRVNLVRGKWSVRAARESAESLSGKLILLGSKVSQAFGVPFFPFTITADKLILPHPSGLCRIWTTRPHAFDEAQERLREFAPELSPFIGKQKAKVEA